MTYLVFMNYIMLVAICGHIGLIASDRVWTILDLIGVFATCVHIIFKDRKNGSENIDK